MVVKKRSWEGDGRVWGGIWEGFGDLQARFGKVFDMFFSSLKLLLRIAGSQKGGAAAVPPQGGSPE